MKKILALLSIIVAATIAQQITSVKAPLQLSGTTLQHLAGDGQIHVPKSYGITPGWVLTTSGGSADAHWAAPGGGGYVLPIATGSVLGGIKSSTSVRVDGSTGVATVDSVRAAHVADSCRFCPSSGGLDTAHVAALIYDSLQANSRGWQTATGHVDSSRVSGLSDTAKHLRGLTPTHYLYTNSAGNVADGILYDSAGAVWSPESLFVGNNASAATISVNSRNSAITGLALNDGGKKRWGLARGALSDSFLLRSFSPSAAIQDTPIAIGPSTGDSMRFQRPSRFQAGVNILNGSLHLGTMSGLLKAASGSVGTASAGVDYATPSNIHDSLAANSQGWTTLTAARSAIHDSMTAERHFDTTVSRAVSHDTATAIRSYVAGAYQPLEDQRVSTTNSPTFAGVTSTGPIVGPLAKWSLKSGSSTVWAMYGSGVTPSSTNWSVEATSDGTVAYISGSSASGLAVGGSVKVAASSTGGSVTGDLTVSGIANAAYLGADANGKLTAKTIAVSDLPASIQAAQSIPVDRIAIGGGSSGLSSDAGLRLLRKTTDPYSGYQIQAGKATMGTWSSDTTMAWFGFAGDNNSYNNYYGIALDGNTTIVGAAASVKLRAENYDGLTVFYQPAGNAGAIASGNFQRTWQTSVTTLPNTSGLPVGFEVHALYPMAPSATSVSVYNPSTDRIRYRDPSGALTTTATGSFVGQAVDFVYLGTYSGTAFWSANSI